MQQYFTTNIWTLPRPWTVSVAWAFEAEVDIVQVVLPPSLWAVFVFSEVFNQEPTVRSEQ